MRRFGLLVALIGFSLLGRDTTWKHDNPVSGRLLDEDRRLLLHGNVVASLGTAFYGSMAEYIYAHISNILRDGEAPSFYDDISMENILRTSVPYRTLMDRHWEKGDIVFMRNSSDVGGFILRMENNHIYYMTVLVGTVAIRSLYQNEVLIRRLLIVNR